MGEIIEFYNKDYKEAYIDKRREGGSNPSLKDNGRVLFRRSAPFERELQKDLYDFSASEIIEFYKSLFSSSLESLMVMNNQYKIYTDDALSNGLVRDNQNHYAEIDLKILNSCVNTRLLNDKIVTREQLINVLNDGAAVENVSDKVLALAIFEGIGGKDLIELSSLEPEDINQQTNMVSLSTGRELEISDQLKYWCLDSADEYTYYNSNSVAKNKKYIDTDTRVLKRLGNSTVDSPLRRHRSLCRRLDFLNDVTNQQFFGVGSLKESGRIDMVKQLVDKGMPLEKALKDKDMEYRYGIVSSPKRYILKFGNILS